MISATAEGGHAPLNRSLGGETIISAAPSRPFVRKQTPPLRKGAPGGLFQRIIDRGELVVQVGAETVDHSDDR
jgi:hypothetical protein